MNGLTEFPTLYKNVQKSRESFYKNITLYNSIRRSKTWKLIVLYHKIMRHKPYDVKKFATELMEIDKTLPTSAERVKAKDDQVQLSSQFRDGYRKAIGTPVK